MAERVGIGIVGFGRWPRTAYVPVLRDLAEANVTAVAARSPKTLVEARQAFGADLTGYHDYRDLLADDRVDAVLVATPNDLHREVAKSALEGGKHVFVEAPFGETSEQALALIDDAAAILGNATRPLVFQADLELGYIPALTRLRQVLREGTVGKVLSATVRLRCGWGAEGKLTLDRGHRLGVFVWVGPWYLHVLDVLFERLPRRVWAQGVRAMNGPMMDHGWAVFDYGQGTDPSPLGRFEFNLLASEGQHIGAEVVGTSGEVRVDLTSGEIRLQGGRTLRPRTECVAPAEPVVAFAGMRECLTSFVHAIAHGAPVLADLEAARRVHRLAFAAQRATDDVVPIELADEPGGP